MEVVDAALPDLGAAADFVAFFGAMDLSAKAVPEVRRRTILGLVGAESYLYAQMREKIADSKKRNEAAESFEVNNDC